MALSSYTDLKNSIVGWLHRDDLVTSVPDFIALAEGRFRKHLRLRQQMTSTTLATVAGVATVALPDGWVQVHRMRLASPDRPIDFLPGAQFQAKYPTACAGSPLHFTVEGADLVFGPVPDAIYSVEAVYYADVPALGDSSPTNWVLSTYPGLYLFGALAESAPFVGQDGRIGMWEAKYAAELQAAVDADRKARVGGPGLRMRAR